MPKPKICFFAPSIFPLLKQQAHLDYRGVGGSELQQLFLAQELHRRGYSVSFITKDFGQGPETKVGPFKVLATFKTNEGIAIIRFLYVKFVKIWQALSRSDADIYYVRGAGFKLAFVALWCRWHHKKVVFCAANDPDFEIKKMNLPIIPDKIMYLWGLKRCHAVVTQNRSQQQSLRENFNREGHLIHNGMPATGNETSSKEIILWVARMRSFKRPEMFLELAKQFPGERFVMVGHRVNHGQHLFENIKREAMKLPNLTFIEHLKFDEIEKLFGRAKVFINTSEYEGFPNTFLQAWRRGVPVISFVDPDRIIRDHRLGKTIKDKEAMFEELGSFLNRREYVNGDAIQRYFKSHLTIEKQVDKYEKTFHSLVTNENRKNKILFFIPSLEGGGAQKVMADIINGLDKDKFEFVLAVCNKQGPYVASLRHDLKIYDLEKKNKWEFIHLMMRLRKVIGEFKPDIIVSFLFYSNILATLASKTVKRRIKLILNERNFPRFNVLNAKWGFLKKKLIQLTYRKADVVTTNSYQAKACLQKEFGIQSDIIQTIYNPVDIEVIKKRCQERIEHPFFQEGNKVILGAGRLVQQKRFDVLLNSFSCVVKNNSNIKLIILGEGEEKDSLEQLSHELGINDSVNFIGFKANPYAWMSKADIFVLSSDFEGFPNVVLEAMTCGVPVISTNCPSGPDEIITNRKNGLLVSTNDPGALADAITTLLGDKKLKEVIPHEAKKRVEDFRVEKILNEYELLFNR